MKVYLVRHGEALSPVIDPEKSLSPQGRAEIQKIAKFLSNKSFPITRIFHSGKARAKQTAEIFKHYLAPMAALEQHQQLGPNDRIQEILSRINDEENMMIVGHLPFLQKLLGFLVTGHEEHVLVNFQAGTVVCLEKNVKSWIIDWVVGKDQI